MYIVVVGGGKVGYHLSRILVKDGHEVTLIEKNPVRAMKLEDDLGDLVVRNDGVRIKVLENVGCARANVVVAVTGRDEDNFVICELAQKLFGVNRTIARLNNPRNGEVFRRLNIRQVVSSTTLIANMVDLEVDAEKINTLAILQNGEMAISQLELPPGSPVANRLVRDIPWPAGCLLVSLCREETGMSVPKGDTVVQEGDQLVIFSPTAQQAQLKALLLENN